ncbi:MAG: HD domain-containing protein [Bdellovibrionales bacterium]|nr:HD domain-containing protein [Bdellovibrionales bacterium]
MARTFLNDEELEKAKQLLKPTKFRATKAKSYKRSPSANTLSLWLGDRLLDRFTKIPEWEESLPIALGSWARFEICPNSDIDLLFAGPEQKVKKVVKAINDLGLKVRHRVPENFEDWTKGVEDYDVMALLHARSFTAEGHEKLHHQQQLIRSQIKNWRKKWLKVMAKERSERATRYDSISNYLEPNIKYGKGGLRDLQQALFLFEIFPEKFVDRIDVKINLNHHKSFLLNLRQHMHLYELGEVIVGPEQQSISQWLGFTLTKDFMKEVQWTLSEVSFYSDWIFERSKTSEKLINIYRMQKIKSISDAYEYLRQDSSRQAQEVLRNHLNTLSKEKDLQKIGKVLKKIFKSWPEEIFIRALFSSGLLEISIPELKRLRGLVQHDQYHRYTVRAHLLQCIREVLRLRTRPKNLGKISYWVKKLNEEDWQILLWTALFHDMAKGKRGDHSTQGADLVKREFIKMKMSLRITVEVAWMVKNHLLLSTAAFRRDPQDPKTWRKLHDLGVKGPRLIRLAVFTALDIRATNPEAWNQWKEHLLHQLVQSLHSPRATKYMMLLSEAEQKKIKMSREFLSLLDPSLVESIPTKLLVKDYQELKKSKRNLETLLWQGNNGLTWVRFHRIKDKAGLFLEFTQALYASGSSIQECYIQTFDNYGVYDWFCVKSTKKLSQLKTLLNIMSQQALAKVPVVKFDEILVTSEDSQQAIISFRGRNKTGALLCASQALYQQGFDIIWARAHTWGRQIDDVFCVNKMSTNIDTKISNLKAELLIN